MKIIIKQELELPETEVTVRFSTLDAETMALLSQISTAGNTVIGTRDEETCFIPLTEVLYFESVDNRVFFYTAEYTYETKEKLYQLEEQLAHTIFARISKNTIANLKKLRSIKQAENSRLIATLDNGEKLMVSRQYIHSIKQKLGVK